MRINVVDANKLSLIHYCLPKEPDTNTSIMKHTKYKIEANVCETQYT